LSGHSETLKASETWGFFQMLNHGVPVSGKEEEIIARDLFVLVCNWLKHELGTITLNMQVLC